MSCRLDKIMGVEQRAPTLDMTNKVLFLAGLNTRALNMSAKCLGATTHCLDAFSLFDIRKLADTVIPLGLGTDIFQITEGARQLTLKAREKLLRVLEQQCNAQQYDLIYPTVEIMKYPQVKAFFQTRAPSFLKATAPIIKVAPDTQDKAKNMLGILFLGTPDKAVPLLTYSVSFKQFSSKTSTLFLPVIASVPYKGDVRIYESNFVALCKAIHENYPISGIFEVIFADPRKACHDLSDPQTIAELNPYPNGRMIDLFEGVLGRNFMEFDLGFAHPDYAPPSIEDLTPVVNSHDTKFLQDEREWARFSFISPFEFAVFAELGGFGARDAVMPGSYVPASWEICTEIIEVTQQSVGLEKGQLIDYNHVLQKYEEEKKMVYSVLGLPRLAQLRGISLDSP